MKPNEVKTALQFGRSVNFIILLLDLLRDIIHLLSVLTRIRIRLRQQIRPVCTFPSACTCMAYIYIYWWGNLKSKCIYHADCMVTPCLPSLAMVCNAAVNLKLYIGDNRVVLLLFTIGYVSVSSPGPLHVHDLYAICDVRYRACG